MKEYTFGSFIKEKRLSLDFTLREFCLKYGLDAAYISRVENEIIPAPQKTEILRGIATALEIEENSEEWVKFFDLASLSRNEIPEDIRNSFSANLHLLPSLLRATKNTKVSKEDLLDLIENLRKDEI